MTTNPSLMARDHGLTLTSVPDALDAIGTGLPGCIFTEADLGDDFFELRNGLAGDIFQKFVNYNFRAAFVVPADHKYGERVTELIREHQKHPLIRFFETKEEAKAWLDEDYLT